MNLQMMRYTCGPKNWRKKFVVLNDEWHASLVGMSADACILKGQGNNYAEAATEATLKLTNENSSDNLNFHCKFYKFRAIMYLRTLCAGREFTQETETI